MVSLLLPLILSGAFGLAAPAVAYKVPPSVATWLLSAGGLVAAAASSAALALMSFDLLGQERAVAASAGWSLEVLRAHSPVAAWVELLATVGVATFAVRFLRTATRRAGAVRAAYRLAASLPSRGSELAVLDSSERRAFAVPGRPGRIAVTTGMLRSLDGPERRALLAHERSHLTHHHHAHHTATRLAAAVNPLLRALPTAVERATERWADEDAADASHRGTVAAALLRAAGGTRPPAHPVVLAAASAHIAERVGALAAPPLRLAPWRVVVPAALLIAAAVSVAVAMHDTERLFELARHDFRAATR